MRNMRLINLYLWMAGGLVYGFFMYMLLNDFKFVFDSKLFSIVLIGCIFFGLPSGYLFGRASHINSKNYDKYMRNLKRRLRKGTKFNKTIYEFNIMEELNSLEQIDDLWSIFGEKIIELEKEGSKLSHTDRWYEVVDMILLEITSGKRCGVSDIKKLEEIQKEISKLDVKTLEKLGLMQINILLAKMMLLIQSKIEVVREEVDEINTKLIYYMYLLKFGLINQSEFLEFINKETLKDNPRDVFIDLQFASGKGVNEIIEVLYHYINELKEVSYLYYMNFISRLVSFEIVKQYREEMVTLESFLVLIRELYSYFPQQSKLHYMYQWKYHPENKGYAEGIIMQEKYSINIRVFFREE